MNQPKFQSLRGKITRTFLLVMGSTGLATLVIVVLTSAQASSEHLASVQRYIEQGITSKGKVLTENHARALRGLTLDNAFLDMQRLVDGVVQEDSDLVYGLYVNSNRETMASSRRGTPALQNQPPAKGAWRDLQIPAEELLVTRESVKRSHRLGEDLLEVAVPVADDEGEVLGTIRYGLSTRPMRDAIAQAQRESSGRMKRSVAWLVAMVSVATLLGLLLSGVQAKKITRPIAELTIAAEARAKGNRAVSVAVSADDEIGLLGESFNRMGTDLDASYRELEALNRDLERKVELRTVELGAKNRDMKLVLDNVGQGFVTLDLEGNMSAERSRVVDDWFGEAGGETKLSRYLAKVDATFAEWFDLGWAALCDGILPMELCLAQLPAMIHHGERSYEVAYRPILEGARIDKVIVVMTDVTVRIEREQAERVQREMMSLFRHTIADRVALAAFFAETGSIVEAIATCKTPDLVVLRRQVHTIKGNAAIFGLESVAAFCDGLENQMDETGEPVSPRDCRALEEMWSSVIGMRNELTADTPAGGVELDREEYGDFLTDLERRVPHEELLVTATSWRFEAARKRLILLKDQIRMLAKRLGRAPVDVIVEPTHLRLPPAKWGPFWSSFTHVLRNTVDHGVGTVQERAAAGKPPEATVVLGVARAGEGVVVTVSDDGPGVNWGRIAERATEQGLPHQTVEDLSAALFADGVSSRSEATSTSGRGVGLSAVLEVVHALGGDAEVQSKAGEGTTFKFHLPNSMEAELPADDRNGSAENHSSK